MNIPTPEMCTVYFASTHSRSARTACVRCSEPTTGRRFLVKLGPKTTSRPPTSACCTLDEGTGNISNPVDRYVILASTLTHALSRNPPPLRAKRRWHYRGSKFNINMVIVRPANAFLAQPLAHQWFDTHFSPNTNIGGETSSRTLPQSRLMYFAYLQTLGSGAPPPVFRSGNRVHGCIATVASQIRGFTIKRYVGRINIVNVLHGFSMNAQPTLKANECRQSSHLRVSHFPAWRYNTTD